MASLHHVCSQIKFCITVNRKSINCVHSFMLYFTFILVYLDEDKIELAVINPAYVMGPVINGSQCVSMEVKSEFSVK